MSKAIYRFLTQQDGKPRTHGLIVDRRHEASSQATSGLEKLGVLANDHPDVCAFGKIAVLSAEGIFTFQVDRRGESTAAFCGNSTAAAIACLNSGRSVRTAVHGMAAVPYEVTSRRAGNAISQIWRLPDCNIAERTWHGRSVLFLRALNHYAVVLGELPEGIDPEAARRELLGGDANGKLAVIDASEGSAVVQFYNSNGRHGAVPQTGIASLALAARSVEWLANCFVDGGMTYLVGGEHRRAQLPAISEIRDGRIELRMPEIEVILSPLLHELAA